jgi:hypothetical protein
MGPQIQYIAPDSSWENGSCESINGKEIFYSLTGRHRL